MIIACDFTRGHLEPRRRKEREEKQVTINFRSSQLLREGVGIQNG